MNAYAKIKCEPCRHTAGGAIVVTQDSDMIAVISKQHALKLADDLRALADTFWNDDPWPVDSSIGKSGAEWAFERGD